MLHEINIINAAEFMHNIEHFFNKYPVFVTKSIGSHRHHRGLRIYFLKDFYT